MTLQQETLFYMSHTLYLFSCWLYEDKRLLNDLLSEYLMDLKQYHLIIVQINLKMIKLIKLIKLIKFQQHKLQKHSKYVYHQNHHNNKWLLKLVNGQLINWKLMDKLLLLMYVLFILFTNILYK